MFTDKLKCWTDCYPFQGEFKGGMKLINSVKWIITSYYSMDEVFEKVKKIDLEALKQRFKRIHFIGRNDFREVE